MNDRIASLVCVVVGAFLLAPALVMSSRWMGLLSFGCIALAIYFDRRAYPDD